MISLFIMCLLLVELCSLKRYVEVLIALESEVTGNGGVVVVIS